MLRAVFKTLISNEKVLAYTDGETLFVNVKDVTKSLNVNQLSLGVYYDDKPFVSHNVFTKLTETVFTATLSLADIRKEGTCGYIYINVADLGWSSSIIGIPVRKYIMENVSNYHAKVSVIANLRSVSATTEIVKYDIIYKSRRKTSSIQADVFVNEQLYTTVNLPRHTTQLTKYLGVLEIPKMIVCEKRVVIKVQGSPAVHEIPKLKYKNDTATGIV